MKETEILEIFPFDKNSKHYARKQQHKFSNRRNSKLSTTNKIKTKLRLVVNFSTIHPNSNVLKAHAKKSVS